MDIQSNIAQNSTGNDANVPVDDYLDPGPVPDVGLSLAESKARDMLLRPVRKVTQKDIAHEWFDYLPSKMERTILLAPVKDLLPGSSSVNFFLRVGYLSHDKKAFFPLFTTIPC